MAAGVQSTSRCSRLVTDALIDDSGVRRSCDTAASSAVRSSLASASPAAQRGLGPQLAAARSASASWPANARSSAEVLVAEPGADSDEHLVVVERHASSRRPRVARAPARPPTSRPPSRRRRAAARRRASSAERRAELRDSAAAGRSSPMSVPLERGQRLGLGPRRAASSRAARRRRHEHADDDPDDEEDHQREQVLASAIVNSWNGGVKYQFASRKPATARRERRDATRRGRRPRRRRSR